MKEQIKSETNRLSYHLFEEPLEIDAYQALASEVLKKAIEDLRNNDEPTRRDAENFCFSNDGIYRKMRLVWLSWIQMDEERFMQCARRFIASSLH